MVAKFCARSHGQPLSRVRSAAMISISAAISREGFSGLMRASARILGQGWYCDIGRDLPSHIRIERPDRPGHMAPGNSGQHRRHEARSVDLEDLRVGKYVVESGAEVAARFHHDAALCPQVDADMLEHGGLHAL